jgi:hypothetical protein
MEESWDRAPFDMGRMIADVEQHLQLPTGTIQPFFKTEEHWVFVLKITSIVETVLKSALFARIRRGRYTGSFGGVLLEPSHAEEKAFRNHLFRIPLNGDIGAIKLASGYDLIADKDEAYINTLASIRNRYAHSILNHSRSVIDIISENRDVNQVSSILKKLQYGHDLDFSLYDRGIGEIEFGALMFLARMSGRFTPPAIPEGGILGGLFSAPTDESPESE